MRPSFHTIVEMQLLELVSQPVDLRILKPLDRTTAVVEIRDGDLVIAEVFARKDGVRRFHLSKAAAAWGPHWEILSKLASQVIELLDAADYEMSQARQSLGD